MAFDDLRETLLAGGIAPRHVRRYLKELREHLDDLTAQQRLAGYDGESAACRARARLGRDDELAAAMLAQKGFRSLASRAPWMVFLIFPPLVAVAIGGLFIGSVVLIGERFGILGLNAPLPPQWFQLLADRLLLAANLTMTPLAATLFAVIARRQRLKPVWPLIATLMLTVLFFHGEAAFAQGNLTIDVWPFFIRQGWTMLSEHWRLAMVQYALTMLPLMWLWRRRLAWS